MLHNRARKKLYLYSLFKHLKWSLLPLNLKLFDVLNCGRVINECGFYSEVGPFYTQSLLCKIFHLFLFLVEYFFNLSLLLVYIYFFSLCQSLSITLAHALAHSLKHEYSHFIQTGKHAKQGWTQKRTWVEIWFFLTSPDFIEIGK